MATISLVAPPLSSFTNQIVQGDCIEVMRQLPAQSVDFVLTDPPYLVNYRDRDGRTIQNDADATWLNPAMQEDYRVLKQDRSRSCSTDGRKSMRSSRPGGKQAFDPVGHIVFQKTYSSKSPFLRYRHEQAYLLAKGRPPLPEHPLSDLVEVPYSGNKLHPTQKPIAALAPLVRSFALPGKLVLDPFAGSGSTCAAALLTGRTYLGIELNAEYHEAASRRLDRVKERIAKRSSLVVIPT